MLATVIRTDVAAKVSIDIMRAFVRMRHYIKYNEQLLPRKYLLLEEKVDNNTKKIDELFDKFNPKVITKNSIFFQNDIYDAYTLVLEYLMNHTEITDDTEYHWYINIDTGSVDVEKEEKDEKQYYESFLHDYHDMSPWCKLASYLDKENYKNITVKFEGVEETYECFSFMYVFQNTIKKLYSTIDNYKSSPHTNKHLAEEYIIKIE